MLRPTNAVKNPTSNIFNFLLHGSMKAREEIDFSRLMTRSQLVYSITRLKEKYVCRTTTITQLVEVECGMPNLEEFMKKHKCSGFHLRFQR